MSHTFDPDSAQSLEDVERFRYLSRDELVGALDVESTATVADIGSGTGFYTREVAPYVGELYAVDMQDEMHENFAEQEIPSNVELVLSPAASLPFENEQLDGVFTTMTYHELRKTAVEEIGRVLRPGGSLVVADWAKGGEGVRGPSLSERKSVDEATATLEAIGFEVLCARSRPETFFVEAIR